MLSSKPLPTQVSSYPPIYSPIYSTCASRPYTTHAVLILATLCCRYNHPNPTYSMRRAHSSWPPTTQHLHPAIPAYPAVCSTRCPAPQAAAAAASEWPRQEDAQSAIPPWSIDAHAHAPTAGQLCAHASTHAAQRSAAQRSGGATRHGPCTTVLGAVAAQKPMRALFIHR